MATKKKATKKRAIPGELKRLKDMICPGVCENWRRRIRKVNGWREARDLWLKATWWDRHQAISAVAEAKGRKCPVCTRGINVDEPIVMVMERWPLARLRRFANGTARTRAAARRAA